MFCWNGIFVYNMKVVFMVYFLSLVRLGLLDVGWFDVFIIF